VLWRVWPLEQATPLERTALLAPLPPLPDRSAEKAAPLRPAPAGATEQPAVPVSVTPRPKIQKYAVQAGDTAGGIAEQFGLKTSTVLWSNSLSSDTILRVGQVLLISAADGILHTVTETDTMWEIAAGHGADVDTVIRANADVSPDNLQPGQTLFIPGGAPLRRATAVASRGGGVQRPDPAPTAPEVQSQPIFAWPLRGLITEEFGWRTHPVYGTPNFHEGIDIAVAPDTPVGAAASGTVTLSAWYGGYGLTVKIRHPNGLTTRYSHNSVLLAREGDSVKAGQLIARSGNTGVSTGPHLDFGVYRGSTPVDPLPLLPR